MDYREIAPEIGEEIIFLEPKTFDEAIVGFQERFGQDRVLIYSKRKIIEILKTDMEGTEEEKEEMALEYYYYNILGGWFGDGTPAFLCDYEYFD